MLKFRGRLLPAWFGAVPPGNAQQILPIGYLFDKYRQIPGAGKADSYQRLSLTMNGVLPRSREATDGLQPESFDSYQLLKPGQLVFKLIDLQNISTSRVGLSEDEGLVSPAYIVVQPSKEVLPRYAYWYFMDLYFRQVFNNLGEDGVRASLGWESLKELPFPLRSIEQQERIVQYLDAETAKIDHLIAKQRKLIDLVEARDTARRNQILDAVIGAPVRLKWLLSPSRTRASGNEEVLSVYRDYGVIRKDSRTDNFNRTPEDVSNYLLVRPGDLVVNKMKAWQGSLGVSEFHGIVSGDYEVLRPSNKEVDLRFLHFLLRSRRLVNEYAIRSKGIRPSQWRLYWQELSEIEILLPPISTQKAVAESVGHTNDNRTMLTACEHMIELLQERRSALITAAVTGQIEV